MRIVERSLLSRRQTLFLAGAVTCLPASGDDFWNTMPPSEWGVGEIYRLMNHSPWANTTEWTTGPGFARKNDTNLPGPRVKAVVTWESALPLREALRIPEAPVYENCYVLGLDGLPSGTYTAEYLRQFARLRATGKSKWTARATSARERIRTSSVYQFAFPRTSAPIGPDTEDVYFEMELKPWTLQSKFKPKEMLYHGELAV